MLIKKYGNRRLYDTARSRYITLEELAILIREGDGEDVHVVSATSGEDLTTATLVQIIVDSRGAGRLLPRSLLLQLIRMGDDALAEFLGQYVTWALEIYVQTKRGMQAMVPWTPLVRPGAGISRLLGLRKAAGGEPDAPAPPAPGPARKPRSAPGRRRR